MSHVLRGEPLAPFEGHTLNELFLSAVARYRDRPALGSATSSERLAYGEAEARIARYAACLHARGVRRGDRVAILSENRPEWVLLDHAILSLGAVTVPIYPTLGGAQAAEILADSGAQLVFVSDAAQAEKVCGGEAEVLFLDALRVPAAVPDDAELTAWRAHARAIAPTDLATLIYTSGTTGTPMGVMLTHENLAAMVAATGQHGSLAVTPGDVALSILPLSHIFERVATFYFLAHGVTVVHAESMQTVARDLLVVRPHCVITVPRLFEKIHHALVTTPGLKGVIARWATRVGVVYLRRPSLALRLQHALADRLVYRVLRERLGGRMRTFICGGAPLEPHIGALFMAAGFQVHEGYGLTETSPVISANQPGRVRLGSAGVPYPGVEVRLGEQAEIQVRGVSVTPGYWRQPDRTAAAFTADGWFRTGDVGAFDADGFVHVVDRLKDLIVTAGGKNVAPQPLELRALTSPLISQAVLLGDRRQYLVLLVVPDAAGLRESIGRDVAFDSEEAQRHVAREVATLLRDAAPFERPKRLALLPEELTVESGLLTPTLKVRRRAVQAAHAALLDAVYTGEAGVSIEWESNGTSAERTRAA